MIQPLQKDQFHKQLKFTPRTYITINVEVASCLSNKGSTMAF